VAIATVLLMSAAQRVFATDQAKALVESVVQSDKAITSCRLKLRRAFVRSDQDPTPALEAFQKRLAREQWAEEKPNVIAGEIAAALLPNRDVTLDRWETIEKGAAYRTEHIEQYPGGRRIMVSDGIAPPMKLTTAQLRNQLDIYGPGFKEGRLSLSELGFTGRTLRDAALVSSEEREDTGNTIVHMKSTAGVSFTVELADKGTPVRETIKTNGKPSVETWYFLPRKVDERSVPGIIVKHLPQDKHYVDVIVVDEVEFNPRVPAETFKLTVPKGATRVDHRANPPRVDRVE
jgi:hypothetical protein